MKSKEITMPVNLKNYTFTWKEWNHILTPNSLKLAKKVCRQGGEIQFTDTNITERFKKFFQ
jgi:hypothetical protein